jgi:hypothetical protein
VGVFTFYGGIVHILDTLKSQKQIEKERIRIRLEKASDQKLKEILSNCRGMGIDSLSEADDIRHGEVKASVIDFVAEEARKILDERTGHLDRE